MNTVGERLKAKRKSLNLSQEQVSEQIGIKKSSLSRIENGETDPSMSTLIGLSQFFNVSADWILFGTDSGPSHQGPEITDPEMHTFLIKIRNAWLKGDTAEQGWIKVQLRKAFPEIYKELKQKFNNTTD